MPGPLHQSVQALAAFFIAFLAASLRRRSWRCFSAQLSHRVWPGMAGFRQLLHCPDSWHGFSVSSQFSCCPLYGVAADSGGVRTPLPLFGCFLTLGTLISWSPWNLFRPRVGRFGFWSCRLSPGLQQGQS